MTALLELEDVLRAGAEPARPHAPAQPLFLAADTQVPVVPVAPVSPQPLGEKQLTQLAEGAVAPSQLAQVEGVAPRLNLGIVPESIREKPKPTNSAPAKGPRYTAVPEIRTPLPSADEFIAYLRLPESEKEQRQELRVAQAESANSSEPLKSARHPYLTHPDATPASPGLIAANELMLAGNEKDAFLAVLDVMEEFSRTPSAADAHNLFNKVFKAMRVKEEAGGASPLDEFEATLPADNEGILQRYQSVESRYALLEFYLHRVEKAIESNNDTVAGAYATKMMAFADGTMKQNTTHPLQSDVLHYYYDVAVLMGGDTYAEAIDYLRNMVEDEQPTVARWTARYLLAQTYHNSRHAAEAILQYGGMLDEVQALGIYDALGDPSVYTWMRAAIELELADAYINLQNFDAAATHYEHILGFRRGSEAKAMAMFHLAYIAEEQHPNAPGIAIQKYQDYLTRYPDDKWHVDALLQMASLYHRYGDYEQAVTLYEEILHSHPESDLAVMAQHELDYIFANQWDSYEVATGYPIGDTKDGTLAMRCGPYALHKMLELHGIESTVEELATLAKTGVSGTSMLNMVAAAKAKGLDISGAQVTDISALKAPFIGHINDDHFILISEVSDRGLTVYDSGAPARTMDMESFTSVWNGVALVVSNDVNLAQVLSTEAMESYMGGLGPPNHTPPTDEEEDDCTPSGCNGTCTLPRSPGSGPQPPGSDCPGGRVSIGVPSPANGISAPDSGGSSCHQGPSTNVTGSPHSPTAISGFNSPGVTAQINTFTTSLNLDESDLSLNTLSAWGLSFGRTYRAKGGFHRAETSDISKVWENNLGDGWSHNLNVHLRTSGGATPSTVAYWDQSGTIRTYSYDSTSGGYDLYYRSATGNPSELGHVLKRNTTTKTFTLDLAGGATIDFTASTGNPSNYARVTALTDAEGNATTFVYDSSNVSTGRLTKVQSPAGDAQHLALTYTGNLITKVELKNNATALNSVSFDYNGSNELIEVTDYAGKTVEYAYGSDVSAPGSRYITKITNKTGEETDLTWTFGLNASSDYEAYKIEVDNAEGLSTVYDRSLTTSVCTITNWDGATLLSKIVNTPVTGNRTLSSSIDYYLDASTYERWAYEYDTDATLTKVIAPGTVTYAEYTYNSVGNVLTQKFGTGPIVEYEYDGSGQRITKHIDAAGIETDYTYDVDGMLEKKEHPAVHADGFQYEYDAYGQMTLTTSPLGTETEYTYDALGRLEEVVVDPGGLDITTSYVYDDLGNMIEMTDPRGKVTEYEYGSPSCGCGGSGGNLIKVTDALSRETEWVYDTDGLLETTIDAAGIETDYTYDDMGRVIEIEHPAGSAITSTITYNKLGQVATRTDFGGNTVSYEYDHMGRVVTVTDAVGDIDYGFNSLGQLVTVTDSLGQVTTNTYDTAFRLTKVTDDIGKETHYAYDSAGRQESVGAGTSGTVDVTTYAYDATTGLLDSVEYGSSSFTASYEYDGEARLVALTDWIDAVDGIRYAYDDVGRLTTLTDYDDSTLTYTYDDAGNVLSMNDYHGNTTAYTYNDIGQLATLTAPGSKVWTYTYDSANRLSQVDIPNGMHTAYTYDASGRQDSIHHKDGATVVQGFDYTFEDGGNITRIDHEDGSYWEYDYDGRERLIEAIRGNKATPTIEALYEYTYDDGDNMKSKATPWVDDFQDGNIAGWSGDTGDYSVASGVMENTLHASWWRGVYLSESDADVDLRFDYIRYSSTGTSQAHLRYTNASNSVYIEFLPTVIRLRQKDGGVLTTLDSISTTVAEDMWYTVRAVADGGEVTVYWGEKGGDSTEILSTASATATSTSRAAYLRASPNSEHGWDNVQVIAGTLGTSTTFTHNDANELTSTTTNGVTTDYEYDEWGRLVEKDDGTHTATYAYRYGSKLYSVTSDFPGEGNVTYETGGDMKRRSRVAGASETWYNWSASWLVVSEENNADGSSGLLTRTYIGRNQAHIDGNSPALGNYKYYGVDKLYSTHGLWNEDKSSYVKVEYVPYGTVYSESGNLESVSRRYTGYEWDFTTTLYYAPFRYYSVNTATWLARDPLEMIDGPNMYAYVKNSPIINVDPLGLACGPGNGLGQKLVPEYCNPFKNKFTNACKEHDNCYAGCCPHKDKSRKDCDKEFLKNMRSTCKGIGKPLCKACAKIFYWAVRVGGKGPYDSDRNCNQ